MEWGHSVGKMSSSEKTVRESLAQGKFETQIPLKL